ncbi:MAG: YqaA family protein [Thermoanaerobaculia bacterium]
MPILTYLTLFAWSFLAATLVPVGSEPVLVQTVRSQQMFLIPVLIATAGNFLGACTTYWIARRATETVEARTGQSVTEKRAGRVMARYGAVALILSWAPIIGDALVAVAGALRIPFARFAFWVALGKAARYAVVAWIALSI